MRFVTVEAAHELLRHCYFLSVPVRLVFDCGFSSGRGDE